jgi:hypothetical protein
MRGVLGVLLAVAALLAGGCGGDEKDATPEPESADTVGTTGVSEEYQVARVVRSFLLAYASGDTELACRRLTPEHRAAVASRSERSCERGLSLSASAISSRDLDRLLRARVTKVDVTGDSAKAEIALRRSGGPELLTAELLRLDGAWHISGDLVRGGLATGRAPKPPPAPPPNPDEERRIRAVFEEYRDAIERDDGKRACALQTPAARERLVTEAVELVGGEESAISEFGALDCEHITLGYEIPAGTIKRVVAEGERGRLTLTGGAMYRFRKLQGEWKLDT